MNKRKIRFNAVDVLIILLVLAAAFALVYIFVLSGRGKDQSEAQTVKIRYVVMIQNLDERFADSVKRGQDVEDAITRKHIGTVVGVDVKDFQKITFDYDNVREGASTAEGRITMWITIEADAAESDRAFTVDDCPIRVGKQFSLMLPDLYGVGYCIDLRKE